MHFLRHVDIVVMAESQLPSQIKSKGVNLIFISQSKRMLKACEYFSYMDFAFSKKEYFCWLLENVQILNPALPEAVLAEPEY